MIINCSSFSNHKGVLFEESTEGSINPINENEIKTAASVVKTYPLAQIASSACAIDKQQSEYIAEIEKGIAKIEKLLSNQDEIFLRTRELSTKNTKLFKKICEAEDKIAIYESLPIIENKEEKIKQALEKNIVFYLEKITNNAGKQKKHLKKMTKNQEKFRKKVKINL
jgi:predicted ribosome quality control (RQC) complex YloA/Tae2 family protein